MGLIDITNIKTDAYAPSLPLFAARTGAYSHPLSMGAMMGAGTHVEAGAGAAFSPPTTLSPTLPPFSARTGAYSHPLSMGAMMGAGTHVEAGAGAAFSPPTTLCKYNHKDTF
ncbi:uncharacterized protein LOC120354699 [Nilaparvata lugens]|uniref:uncharacterized protein LOC120354699 n=1 Tax=Nilaparvata lugens TaxID=108931 RepID=UPI00193E8B64|nr:uncharacterized protein LOC120354699 [Nilaparvata lugens]